MAVHHEVIIIGAGLSGLAIARELASAGIDHLIVEAEAQIGEPWRARHDQLHLNTHRDLSTLPGMNYPAGTKSFPPKQTVIDYLGDYARENQMPIRFNCPVAGVVQHDDGFILTTDAEPLSTKHLIIATGREGDSPLPSEPDLSAFKGELLHSRHLGDVSRFADRHVLVIGAGNSGFDCLNHLQRANCAQLALSARSRPALLPKRLFGVTVHRFSPWLEKLPISFADHVINLTEKVAFGDLNRVGLPPARFGGATGLTHHGTAIAVDDGAVKAIKKGRITVHPAIEAVANQTVRFAGGNEAHVDTIICATGYQPAAQRFIPDPWHRQNIVGLHFIGMQPSLTSYFRQAAREAKDIATRIQQDARG